MLPDPFHLIPITAHRRHKLASQETAFHQDDQTRGLFFVLQGKIELRRVTKAGQNVIIHRACQGETFAEASLFSARYHCDAIAIVASELIELDRAVILTKFAQNPQFALSLAKRFAQQNHGYRRKLELLAIKSARERIFVAVSDGLLDESIKTFSAEIGLTHEVVYRGLAQLVTKGDLVKTGRGKYDVVSVLR